MDPGRGLVAVHIQPHCRCTAGEHLECAIKQSTDDCHHPGLGKCLKRPSCKPRLDATSDRVGAAQQEEQGWPRPDAACLFVCLIIYVERDDHSRIKGMGRESS